MSQKEFKYDAFISYRHADLDSFVAETLHKQLESFKVPKIADKEIKQTGKKGMKRVFRDKEELPLVGNLSTSITEALKESEFLLVICSPRTMESLWVQREIETFLEYRDASHILAILIEGEPSEAFPPQICRIKKEISRKDGVPVYEEVEVEPLAADVRGNSKKEIKAKLKKEMLRIAAPMLGCEYDDLKQRHRERKIRRLLVTFATIGTICLLFGAFSTYQALRIQRQSEKIKEQSEDLQILQSKSLSDTAMELYKDGDRLGGLLVALAGVPENLEEPERPIVAESTQALAKILQVYQNETSYEPYLMLSHDTITETSVLNEDATILVSLDQLGQLYSWDVETGKLLDKTEDVTGINQENNIAFVDKNTIICAGKNGIACMNASDFSVKWSVPDISIGTLVLSEDKTMAAVSERGMISVYHTVNGEKISSYTDEKYGDMGNCMRFSPDGNYLAASLTSFFENGAGKAILLTTKSCEPVRTYETKFLSIEEIFPTNEGECYIESYDTSTLGEFGMSLNENLSCFNADGSLRFEIEGMMAIISPIRMMGEYIVYPNGSSMCIASSKDGSMIQEIPYNSNICNYLLIEESSIIIVGLSDGSVVLSLIKGEDVLSQQYLGALDDRMRHVYYYPNKIVEEPILSNKILVYKNVLGSKAELFQESDMSVRQVKAVSDNHTVVVYTGEQITAFQTENQKELYYLKPQSTVAEMILMEEEDKLLLIEFDRVEVFQLSDGKRLASLEADEDSYLFRNNRLYTKNEEDKVVVYDMESLSQIAAYDLEEMQVAYPSMDETIIVGSDYNGDGFYYDTKTKEKTALGWNGKILVSDGQGSTYFIADSNTNQACVYQFGKSEPEAAIDMKADFIDDVAFSPDGEKILIGLKDDSARIYKTSDLSLLKTLKNVSGINRWEKPEEGNIEVLYDKSGSHNGYLLNENMEMLYEIPEFKTITDDGKKIYSSSGKYLYTFPVYNLQMLVEEARELLDGRELTPEEKKQYYVN